MAETLLQQPQTPENAAPPTAPVEQLDPQPTPAHPEHAAPFYTLDEAEIRQKIHEALTQRQATEKPKVVLYTTKEWQHPRREYEDAERAGDANAAERAIDKARLMAMAMNPTELAAKAERDNALAFFRDKPDSWATLFRHPIKTLKVAKAGIKTGILTIQGDNAAQIVGERFDAMLTAAMPYIPKVDVPQPIKELFDTGKKEKEYSPETEKLVQDLKLDAQLQEQVAILTATGMAEQITEAFPLPTPDQLRSVVESNRELIEFKANQGFTRLLVVPKDADEKKLAEVMHQRVLKHFREEQLLDTRHKPMELYDGFKATDHLEGNDLVQPIETTEIEDTTTNDNSDPTPGWSLLLVRNTPESPYYRKDAVFMGGRPELLPGATPKQYREILRTNPYFYGEKGFTAAMWYSLALSELERNNVLIDTHGATLLLGSYQSGHELKPVPWIGWARHKRHMPQTARLRMSSQPQRMRTVDMTLGVRTAVKLT